MSNLYLIRRSDGAVWVYAECGQGKWQQSRLSMSQFSKVKLVLHKGPTGWVVQDESPGRGGSSCLAVPVAGVGTSPPSGTLADSGPPRGLWKSPDGKCEYTLSDRFPEHSPLETPIVIEEPFVTVTFTETGATSRLHVKFTNGSITDDGLERMLSKFEKVLVNLARRPNTTMVIASDLRGASVPGMRHVRRFMAWAKERGDIMELVIRGNAMLLKPTGFIGIALVNIVKMLQRVLQAAWPETIVPDDEQVATPLIIKDVIAVQEQVAPQLLPVPFASPTHEVVEVANDAEPPWKSLTSDDPMESNSPTKIGNVQSPNRRHVSRRRSNAVAHPDLVRLEVPVWVAMGYRSGGRPPRGCTDSMVQDADPIMEGEHDPMLCGCSCASKEYALQPQLQALFARAG